MIDFNTLLAQARQANKTPDLARILRDLSLENGALLQVMGALIEARDGIVESSATLNLDTPQEINRAVMLRGQAQGISSCLDIIHRLMTEESEDALLPANIV